MERLTLHLKYLLDRHDCVILPGFGCFTASNREARIDMEHGIMLPPTREISWNSSLRNDDGLLANSYSRRNATSFESGRLEMLKDIDKLRQELEDSSEVAIGNMGLLIKRKDIDGIDHTRFIPRLSPLQCAALTGCGIIKIFEKETPHIVSIESKTTDKTTSAYGNTKSEQVSVTKENDDEYRYYHFRINKIFARAIAAVIISVISIAGIWTAADALDNFIYRASELATTPSPLEIKATQEEDTGDIEGDRAIKREDAGNTTADDHSEVATDNVDKKHHLIVATFHKETDVDKFINQHPDYSDHLHAIPSNKIYRISYKDSDDIEELRQLMRDNRTLQEFGQGWIYTTE